MKKILQSIILTSTLIGGISLSSCSSNKKEKLFLLEREYQRVETKEISKTTLSSKMANKNSFILYISDPLCSSCSIVTPFIESYIRSSNALIYSISTSSLDTNNEYVPYSVTPTLAFIKDGVVVDKIDYVSNESLFASSSSLSNYISSKVSLSPQIEITETQYDELIASKETFIILFRWSKCGDCVSMDSYFFDQYKEKHLNNTFYSFELSEKYDARDPELKSEDPNWKAFTKKVGLSKEGNEEFGYNNGVVPTFQYREKGIIKDAVVVYNDGMEYNKNDNDEITSLTITSSYFTNAPFIGKTYESTSSLNFYQNYKKSTASFYEEKVENLFKRLYK